MNSSVKVIKLAVTKVEDFSEKKGNQPWVFWGLKNDYPQKLIKLFNESAKHGAIVTGKMSYIAGRGLNSSVNTPEAEKFIEKINPKERTEDFLKKVVLDSELIGGYAILCIPNYTKDKFVSFYHVEVAKIRISEDGKTIYVSDGWEKIKTGRTLKFKHYPAYESGVFTESIIFHTFYRPGIGLYPQPEYTQGLAAIETDARVSNFHLNNLRNGFFANKIINVNSGVLAPEAQDEMERAIEDKFTSDENAGKFMLMFNDGTERAATITDLSAGDFGEQFGQLRKDTEQEIFIAHKIPSPMLFGVRVEGQLGGRNELLEAFELFNRTYIEEKRVYFENLLSELARIKGIETEINIDPFVPMQMQMSENIMAQVLTKDEIRGIYGFEPLSAVNTLAQFRAQDDSKDIAVFSRYGTSKENFEKLSAVEIKHLAMADMDVFHTSFNDIQKSEGVTESEKKILEQIAQGKKPNIEAKTTEKLKQKKLVETDRESGALRLTQLGGLILSDLQPNRELTKLKTVYEYVKRPDASGPEVLPDGRTRPFCEALINSNKYFSREDIINISAELGYDVWQHRGGWFTLPNGNHRPSCRHIWNAVLVAEK